MNLTFTHNNVLHVMIVFGCNTNLLIFPDGSSQHGELLEPITAVVSYAVPQPKPLRDA